MQKFKSESIAAGERAYAVNIEANHTLKSSKKEVKILSNDVASSSDEVRRAAEIQRVDFAVKMTVNTNKDERVGIEEAITEVELLGVLRT